MKDRNHESFKKDARSILESKDKIKIAKPDKDAMKKDYDAKYKEWKKKNPRGSEWQFARQYMKEYLGFA